MKAEAEMKYHVKVIWTNTREEVDGAGGAFSGEQLVASYLEHELADGFELATITNVSMPTMLEFALLIVTKG